MAQSKPSITGTTHTLPFDRLSPRDFERLCLWLVEREGFERAEHLGAAGALRPDFENREMFEGWIAELGGAGRRGAGRQGDGRR